MAGNAMQDTSDGRFYHPECAPSVDTLIEANVDGVICDACETLIEDEDPEGPTTHEEEDED